jgi:hypothetical protein
MSNSDSNPAKKYTDAASSLTRGAKQAAAGTHPQWCDFGPDCGDPDAIAVDHAGHVTSFYPSPDDCRVTMKLVHHEDRMHDGKNYGSSGLIIALQTVDGAKADVLLDATDVAFLASKLEWYRRELEDPDREWWDTQERLSSPPTLA